MILWKSLTFKQLIETLVYARTKLSVLELGTTARSALSIVLPSLPQELLASGALEYTFTTANEQPFETLKGTHGERVTFRVLNPTEALELQGFGDKSFDIVIDSSQSNAGTQKALRKLLGPTGKLCLLLDDDEDLESILESHDLAIDFVEQGVGDSQDLQFVFASSAPDIPSHEDIIILEGDHPCAAALTDALESLDPSKGLYIPVPRRLLRSSLQDIDGKTCIVTLEMGRSFLANVSQEDFAAFKEITRRSSNVVWISSSDDPVGSIVTGLARTMRNENSSLIFRSLQVSSKDMHDSGRLADIVSRLALSSCADSEFRLEDGVLKVSRIMQDPEMNKLVSSMVGQKETHVRSSTLNQVKEAQKLALPQQGLLEDIHFETDESADKPLLEDEVEIEIIASGIK